MTDIIYNEITQPVAFEGASRSFRAEQRGLVGSNYDKDTIAARELAILQMRSAHAIRNNGYAEAGRANYVASLGEIKVLWKGMDGVQHELMQDLWDEFAANPSLDGHGTMASKQATWNSTIYETGCAFSQMVVQRTGNNNTVPLKLHDIPSGLHDILYNGISSKDNIKTGIKFVSNKPKHYYFRQGLYNDLWYGVVNTNPYTVVPAKDLIHIFERTSPGQWLGIPKLAPILHSLYELDELADATIAKQKAAQAIAWIVEQTGLSSATPTGTPSVSKDDTGKGKVVFKTTGGNTQYLNKGEKIHFYQSTDIGANLPILIKSELQRAASSLGIPYYILTGDTDGLDFSTIRALLIQLRSRLEHIHNVQTIPLGIGRVTERFKELATLYGNVSDATAYFQLPRWYGVDDLKDSQANLLDLSMGATTIQRIMSERHLTVAELEESKGILDRLGLGHLMTTVASGGNQVTNVQANANSSV